jgi:hypothetical protein
MSRLRRPAASGFAIGCYSLPAGKFSLLPAARQRYSRFRRKFPWRNREARAALQRTRGADQGAPERRRQADIYNSNTTISRPRSALPARRRQFRAKHTNRML